MMANFKEHLSIGTVVGGLAATSLLVAEQADPPAVLLYLMLAIIGSVLPDIDADTSTPLQVAFTFFAILFAFLALFRLAPYLSVIELVVTWFLVFLFFKLAVFALFIRITVHRGIFHSLPAAIFFGFLTTLTLSHAFQLSDKVAWLAGGFVLLGCVTHLLLDELFSLNLLGVGGVKHSLGSAFKLYSTDWRATAMLYVCMIGLFFLLPRFHVVHAEVWTAKTWQILEARLLPSHGWFGLAP